MTFKPLIICGPMGVGKTSLINYLRYNHPEFKYVVPYTNRTAFDKSEIEGTDFIKATTDMFQDASINWFLLEELEAQGAKVIGKVDAPHIPYLRTRVR